MRRKLSTNSMTEIINANENIKFCEDTMKMMVQANIAYIITAKRLAEIAEKRLYLPKWESFDEFTMECIKESKGKTNELMNIYRKYVVMGEIPEETVGEVPWTVLRQTLPLVKTKNDAEYWLEQATTLTPSDFKKTMQESKSGKKMSECKHEKKYFLEICENCKQSHEVYDIAAFNETDLQAAIEEGAGIEVTYGEAQSIFKALARQSYARSEESIHETE